MSTSKGSSTGCGDRSPGRIREKQLGLIAGKEKKLANESFVSRAPAEVVNRERESLEQLREQLAATRQSLAALRAD